MKTNSYQTHFRASLVAFTLCLSAWAGAQSNELSVKMQLERSTVVDGKTVYVPTERAAPGEVLQYVVTYENITHSLGQGRPARPLAGVLATLPIPSEMVYTGATQPKPSAASLDGKTFTPYPVTKIVKQADGINKTIQVDWAEYKALRWSLPEIAIKSSVGVSASVQLLEAQAVPSLKQ